MDKDKKIKVLFVCMGNICRSPTADAIFKYHVKAAGLEQFIEVDSAGTHSYHIGASPDKRAQAAAQQRGYEMHNLRARAVQSSDFDDFDYILAMDNDNLAILKDRCPRQLNHKLALFMQYSKSSSSYHEISDPYYGGTEGFENVLDRVETASQGLLEHIRSHKF
ncbi:MAG: low molecular weight protein-tyrosine-phosphatase [Nitrosomonas sp.]|nr:low molecular weight protein-tyrosine-phosphatase [Nitrosomonas sp.]